MKFAFYISGNSARLRKFLSKNHNQTLENVGLVLSDQSLEESYISNIEKLGIAYSVLEYSTISGASNKERNLVLSDWILKKLETYQIDYCFSFGGHILAGELLEHYKNRIINFHPAILPMYPGVQAIDQAVAHGNTFLVGNTAHFIDSGMDTGPIIMQTVIPLHAFHMSSDYDVILDLQIDMLTQLIHLLENDRIHVEGKRVLIEGANYMHSASFPYIETPSEQHTLEI